MKFSMQIKMNKILIKDILIGDVWFCSGQSNMVHQLNIHDVTYAKEIAEASRLLLKYKYQSNKHFFEIIF